MIHEQLQQLVAAYALDALDPAEASLVEAHLTTCPRCRAELDAHRQVAAMLGDAGGPARPEIWERITGRLAEAPPPLRLPIPQRRSGTVRWLTTAVAAAAAAAIAFLGWDVSHLAGQVDRPVGAPAAGIVQAARAAARAPGARRIELRSATGALTAEVVVAPGGQAYLLASTLPALPSDRTYQLWGLSRDRPVSLGLLGTRAAPSAFRVDLQVTRLMVTAEPAGGVPAPTGPVLVQGALAPTG
ncbi:MAG: anti-sigma factor [Actinomycetota bacterium]|nr:anti-sigma factor [Actinomycetota bacterium]